MWCSTPGHYSPRDPPLIRNPGVWLALAGWWWGCLMQEQGLAPRLPSLPNDEAEQPDCPFPRLSGLSTTSRPHRSVGERQTLLSCLYACAGGRGDHLHRAPSGPTPLGHWQHGGAQSMTGFTCKPCLAHMQGPNTWPSWCLIQLHSLHACWSAVVSCVCGAGWAGRVLACGG